MYVRIVRATTKKLTATRDILCRVVRPQITPQTWNAHHKQFDAIVARIKSYPSSSDGERA